MPGLNLFAGAHETALFGLSIRNIAPPAPTIAPSLYPNALNIRQDASSEVTTTETCAWFSHTVSDLGWEALQCDEPCTTSGSLFGCQAVPTTCLAFSEPGCQNTASPDAWCCDSNFPHCITGVLDEEGGPFTAFRCGNDALSGEVEIYADTSTTRTSVVSSGDDRTTVTVVETPTETPEDNDDESGSNDDTSNPGDSDSQNGNDDNNNNDNGGGSSTPVGAIVGGVIGGVALIVGIAFAVWFIRFQKKKQANKAAGNGMEPYRYDQSGGYAGGYPQQQQGGYDYSQGGYNNGQYSMGAVPPPFSQAGGSPKLGDQQPQMQQVPVEMPEYSNYGAPSELPSEGTTAART